MYARNILEKQTKSSKTDGLSLISKLNPAKVNFFTFKRICIGAENIFNRYLILLQNERKHIIVFPLLRIVRFCGPMCLHGYIAYLKCIDIKRFNCWQSLASGSTNNIYIFSNVSVTYVY